MEKYKLLVIDDDIELCELLKEYLETEGYSFEAVHNGKDGADSAVTGVYDLVILDVMLPGLNGFEALREIRSKVTTPVLMLTAKGDDIDKILGLEMGADDYLPKPYNPRELLARIKAILRRSASNEAISQGQPVVTIGNFILDNVRLAAKYKDSDLGLTVVEFNILKLLISKKGKVVTRDEIAETVLGRELSMYDRSIDVHISNIRKKACNPDIIKSIRGSGYQIIPETD